ncbi:MAG: LamG-like jellyroll fold domain-containing protein [Nocardioides sp.]
MVAALVTTTLSTATATEQAVPAHVASRQAPDGSSAYEARVLADRPASFLRGRTVIVGSGRDGVSIGSPKSTRLPNGDPAFVFDGSGQYLKFDDRPEFQIATKGVLTVEYWMRPDALQFPDEEGTGYVYVIGKGGPSQHEWYGRMYSKRNAEDRPNRISGYAFNPKGGLGAGSYFEDATRPGRWMHVGLVFNTRARSANYPAGYTKIYKNGRLRDKDSLEDYSIVPRSGEAPLRLGTGYLDSYFLGAIGNVAFYPRELAASQLRAHVRAMRHHPN